MTGTTRSYSKTSAAPKRPFKSARLDQELKVGLTLSKIRRTARELLKLDEKDPRRLFKSNALICCLVPIGVLGESRMKLDYVLALKIEDFLERRLQTRHTRHIDFALTSPYGGGRAGRVKRKRAAAASGGDAEEDEE
ncbi:hypothetical protein BY458DRAFT_554093 [Sporodiniella umbellata]|nr:hypothetical protein BY458DRAFT_554093 [Sporodiniella umbellata]